jgi:hypothetical protein
MHIEQTAKQRATFFTKRAKKRVRKVFTKNNKEKKMAKLRLSKHLLAFLVAASIFKSFCGTERMTDGSRNNGKKSSTSAHDCCRRRFIIRKVQ